MYAIWAWGSSHHLANVLAVAVDLWCNVFSGNLSWGDVGQTYDINLCFANIALSLSMKQSVIVRFGWVGVWLRLFDTGEGEIWMWHVVIAQITLPTPAWWDSCMCLKSLACTSLSAEPIGALNFWSQDKPVGRGIDLLVNSAPWSSCARR